MSFEGYPSGYNSTYAFPLMDMIGPAYCNYSTTIKKQKQTNKKTKKQKKQKQKQNKYKKN